MKKLIHIIFCSFILSHANAQDQLCDATAIMNVKGEWKTDPDNIVYPDKTFPASQYNQLRTRLDKIAMLFKEAYSEPTGMQAIWFRSIRGSSLVEKGPVPYQFNSLYKSWYCNQNLHKLMLGAETGTWSYVYVNNFGWLMTDQWDKLGDKIEGTTAFLFPKKIGEWKGFPLYEPSSGSPNKCKAILITRNNQLPYKPVTRLQFLKSMKEKIETNKKAQIDVENKMVIRTDAEQEASKQTGMENTLKYAPASRVEERKANYLKNYKTDQQRKEENIQNSEKYYNGLIKGIDDVWKSLNEEQLREPAIVDNVSYAFLFKGFTTLEKGGRMIVFVNNDYFNLKLPRHIPQFIVLYWQWDKNTPAQNFKKQIEENFQIDQLKAMIDK